jgi:diguanylate cyclase (GGDEF)-like protein
LGVIFEYCERRGFDDIAIAERLGLVGLLDPKFRDQGEVMQSQVIRPNANEILDGFYFSLSEIDDFNNIIDEHTDPEKLRLTQKQYLLSLGVDFDSDEYFQGRLRVGSVHQKIGIPQSLYQCTFQKLQALLIRHIPQQDWQERSAADTLIQFILKITALDMSLAVESYCASRMDGLESSLENVRGEKDRLHRLSVTDWLTNLHNHSYSRHFLDDALRLSQDCKSPLCVIMADLDNFKKVNDQFGHLVGDKVLQIVAARMVSGARADDEVCRYGGEEFLFVLQHTNIEEGMDVAERVRRHINCDAIHAEGSDLWVSLSLGIAQARDGDNVDSLIGRADKALYSAKQAGRDCVRAAGVIQ